MGTLRLIVDSGEKGKPLVEAAAERLGELRADRGNRLWLDISDPGQEEVDFLRREFGFHELTLDEVTRPHERPRCDSHAATTSSSCTPRSTPAPSSFRASSTSTGARTTW